MKTLEEIIKKEQERRTENGAYGIKACKESILEHIEFNKKWNEKNNTNTFNTSLYVLLEEYVKRANEDIFFNDTMVLACWELINNK